MFAYPTGVAEEAGVLWQMALGRRTKEIPVAVQAAWAVAGYCLAEGIPLVFSSDKMKASDAKDLTDGEAIELLRNLAGEPDTNAKVQAIGAGIGATVGNALVRQLLPLLAKWLIGKLMDGSLEDFFKNFKPAQPAK